LKGIGGRKGKRRSGRSRRGRESEVEFPHLFNPTLTTGVTFMMSLFEDDVTLTFTVTDISIEKEEEYRHLNFSSGWAR